MSSNSKKFNGRYGAFIDVYKNEIIIGRILGFSYITGKGQKIEYSAKSALIKPPKRNAKEIICLNSQWLALIHTN